MTVAEVTGALAAVHINSIPITEKTLDATIPCFDLRDLDSLSPAKRADLIQAFGKAMEEVGFVALKAPEMTAIVDRATALTKTYFEQDLATRKKDWHENNGQTGYAYVGLETAAGSDVIDLKETFFVTDVMPAWPILEGFQPAMEEYLDAMTDYANTVGDMIWEYLGESQEARAGFIYGGDMRIRLAYYPPPKSEDDPRSVWAAAHQDLNWITLLASPTRPGLELKTKTGEWMPVSAPKGYIIVNTGDMMTYRTAGRIKGTEHQVINRDFSCKEPRIATICFASLPDSYMVGPFQSCADLMTKGMTPSEAGDYLRQYPNVTAGDLRFARLIEMGSVSSVTEGQIRYLRNIGLIQNPCDALKAKFPKCFN